MRKIMATKKKSTIKTASKPTSKVTATKKKVVKKAAVKKTAVKKSPSNANKIKVTLEQHHKMICEAAYYISLEKNYETVNPTEDWLQAEAAINKICTVHSK